MNTTLLILGIILLALGGLSWIIYIPIFSDFWVGEIGGLCLICKAFKSEGERQPAPISDFTPDSQ